MRAGIILLMGCVMLAGCEDHGAVSGPGPKSPGRYSGIGTFDAGRLWREMAGAAAPANPQSAKLEDDEHVIVVVDSHSGEVRQCGDHSGFCVTMNPWAGNAPRAAAPVALKRHAAELDREDADGASNASVPAE